MRLRIFYIIPVLVGLLGGFGLNTANALDFDNFGNSVAPAPDLVVDSIQFWTGTVPMAVTVKNQGGAPSAGATRVEVKWLRSNGTTQSTGTYPCIPVLVAGGAVACAPSLTIPSGATKVKVTVNPSGSFAVPEGNIDNNSKESDIPPEPLPDLVVTSGSVNEDSRIATFTVKNTGNRSLSLIDLRGMRMRLLRLNANNALLEVDQLVTLGTFCTSSTILALEPGASFDCIAPTPLSNRVAKLRVFANQSKTAGVIRNPIRESNYSNNSLDIAVPAPKLPDLIVHSIAIDPDTRIPVVTLKNQGTGPLVLSAATLKYKKMYFDATGKSLWLSAAGATGLCNNIVEGFVFAVGQTLECVSTPISNRVARVKVTVNPLGVVEETTRANNTLEVTAPAPKYADLVVESISIDEQTRIPTITVKNQGDAPALLGASRMGLKIVLLDAAGRSLNVDRAFYAALCPNVLTGAIFPHGTTKECIGTPLSNRVARIKVTVNPYPRELVGKVLDAVLIEEKTRNNNTLEAAVPLPLIPDFLLENVTFTDASNPILTVKNIGRADFGTGPLPFAVTVYGANGYEIRLESANVLGVPCNFAEPLAMGQTRECRLDTQVTLAAKRMKVVLNAVKVGYGVRYTSEELSTANNTKTVVIPVPPTPDLSIEAVTFNDARNPSLTIKNVGTKFAGSGPVVFAATVYNAAGYQIPLESANVVAAPCVLESALQIGETVTCNLQTQLTNNAKRVKITLNAIKVGNRLQYLSGDLSTNNNTKTGVLPPPKFVDFSLEAVTVNAAGNPSLTVKNVGTADYGSGPVVFAATVYNAAGYEIPLESANVVAAPCTFDAPLVIGATKTCHLDTQVTTAAKRIKITLNAVKTGTALRYVDLEHSTTNNTRTGTVPPRTLPDFELLGVSFNDAGNPTLTVKNVGTLDYGTDPIVMVGTVYDAAGQELPLESFNMTAVACVFSSPLHVGETQNCNLATQLTRDAKRVKVVLNAVKVGPVLQYLGGELSSGNNTFEAPVPELVPAPVVQPEYAITGTDHLQAEQQLTFSATQRHQDGSMRMITGGSWSVEAGGVGGTINQQGVYTAPYAAGRDTIVYVFTDATFGQVEIKKTVLVEPMLIPMGQ